MANSFKHLDKGCIPSYTDGSKERVLFLNRMYWHWESVSGIFLLSLLLLASPHQGINLQLQNCFINKPINLVGERCRQYVLKYICFKTDLLQIRVLYVHLKNTIVNFFQVEQKCLDLEMYFYNGDLGFDVIVLELLLNCSTLIQLTLFFSLVKVMVHRKKLNTNHFLFLMVSTGKQIYFKVTSYLLVLKCTWW